MRPKTATFWPGRTFAELKTAPAPVTTAQPNIAAMSKGTEGSIRISVFGTVTEYWAGDDTPL
jgi:hypothetical protein